MQTGLLPGASFTPATCSPSSVFHAGCYSYALSKGLKIWEHKVPKVRKEDEFFSPIFNIKGFNFDIPRASIFSVLVKCLSYLSYDILVQINKASITQFFPRTLLPQPSDVLRNPRGTHTSLGTPASHGFIELWPFQKKKKRQYTMILSG
ncbi:hypothetical protein KIL84_019836 [Mauremys mutica]|uniref:Uncharacterized protein n=1 Tax=Mauremys mutica TaxID=74926 RepID=A0A9D3XW12_9SAUR|nr:hypothetical protein KIL84_019836 [Mauremys mutica]